MAKDKKPTESVDKPTEKPKRKRLSTSRRTRFLALEPRVVFDGAIGAEIVQSVVQGMDADSGTADASRHAPAEAAKDIPVQPQIQELATQEQSKVPVEPETASKTPAERSTETTTTTQRADSPTAIDTKASDSGTPDKTLDVKDLGMALKGRK